MIKSLTKVKIGKKYKVVLIEGKELLKRSLSNFGIEPDSEIEYSNKFGSNYIVFCKGVKYGLDKPSAKAIFVEAL